MLYRDLDGSEAESPEDLREQYETELAGVVEAVGVADAADETGIDRERLDALVAGESPELTVEEACEILALEPEEPDAEIVRAEVEDRLLLGMTTAVLDVDTIAANLDADLSGKEVHQRVEGRAPMTLAEYAEIHHFIGERKR
ncbi:DUF5791 family protein [Halalkalicoccus jeotgali]|uniref:Uncharacterized protein n=1 Tax=Halalkalicoccus jeotgali (strain DSM 18796 / CECT 7217 / JCM 14584 / KCTC 4019 / B3) TaxID=795797 RepID=D8J8G6_HALJB|nr:DUF5791 family protein [Halalkalicoccus jeotgali]ADJ16212.1 hypothetical protein HacjB3_14155 [Halalkalicoccus jeotgali B3]ELY37640.1 hypothetical protein C497_09373 [Halalkalicoccus jeotgali B3]